MDDLMVWNRVLSQTEITQAYNGTLSLSNTLDFLNLYPNPTSSIINIDYEFSIAKVFDLTGRKVLESRLKTIDLSEHKSNDKILPSLFRFKQTYAQH